MSVAAVLVSIRRSLVPFVCGAAFSAMLVTVLRPGEKPEAVATEDRRAVIPARPENASPKLTALRKSAAVGRDGDEADPEREDSLQQNLEAEQWRNRYTIVRRGWVRSAMKIEELEEEIRILNGGEPRKIGPEMEAALAEKERLAKAPAIAMKVEREPLFDVLRFLFEESGVPYMMPEQEEPPVHKLISYDWKDVSPFVGLEVVARNNGFNLVRHKEIWTLEQVGNDVGKQVAQWVAGYERVLGRPTTEEEFDSFTNERYPVRATVSGR